MTAKDRTDPHPGGDAADDDPTGWKTARRFIGLWREAPAEDLAEEHDRYLYDEPGLADSEEDAEEGKR